MRVVVNRLPALGPRTGVGHYTAELLRCLHHTAEPGEVHEFPQGWLRRAREVCARARPKLEAHHGSSTWMSRLRTAGMNGARTLGRWAVSACFRALSARQKFDLYHEPNFIPLPSNCQTVVTICDLSVLLHPEWHPADRVAHFEKHFHKGLKRCAHFLAISDHGRREIIDTLGIPAERVTRTYMGIRPGLGRLPREQVAAKLRTLGLPQQYLLHLGTLEPRKNLLVLMKAYCDLPSELRERWPLVLAGGWGWNTGEMAEFYHSEARHRGVRHLGYLPEEHLPAVYNGARALVYPTLYEGFGLPPLEMMACGGAVLASTAGAVVETCGRRAHLIEPEDVEGWKQALQRIVTDQEWWQSLRHGVEVEALPFTWENCAAETLGVYRRLCGGVPAQVPLAA
jgi:alpha-1,3-rhamnosyl/mannosyltransferase